jgi:hypothetical protein
MRGRAFSDRCRESAVLYHHEIGSTLADGTGPPSWVANRRCFFIGSMANNT